MNFNEKNNNKHFMDSSVELDPKLSHACSGLSFLLSPRDGDSRLGVFHLGSTVVLDYGFSLFMSHVSSGLISFYSKGTFLVIG